jgi:hypothetical protein
MYDHHKLLDLIYNSQIKCFQTHVDMEIFPCFGVWNLYLKFVSAFQLHPV